MPRRSSYRRNSYNNTSVSSLFRRPAVQLGLLGVAVLIIVIIVLANGGQSPATTSLGSTINVDDAYKLYQSGGVFFLDVREQSEWDEYHIPNTTLVPLGQLQQRLTEVPKDKPIVVVCRSGNRSDVGRDTLLAAGYTNVTSMDGGVSTWKTQGYPVEP
jgi:rhodanese-related sulfurtransferase